MSSRILYWQKAKIQERYLIELKIYEIGDPVRYPDGVKFSLICIDLETGRQVLMDNHHPKGAHTHLDDVEIAYKFTDVTSLMADFKNLVLEHLEVKL
jgi:hypothetical protein